MGRFGISQPVGRREDPRLLTGRGRFTDDRAATRASPPLRAVMLRAPYAHARIVRIDVSAARAAPGVAAVYTAADLHAAGVAAIASLSAPTPRPGSELRQRAQPLLAAERVRFCGEGVAWIVADGDAAARDAAARVDVEYDELPAVTAPGAAAAAGAPAVWDDAPGNLSFDWQLGDADAVERAFAAAAHVVTLGEVNNRVIVNALETRVALAEPGDDGRLTLTTGTQMPNGTQRQLSQVLGLAPERIRVRVDDVGGGFGGKNSLYPEQALAVYTAARLGRAVRWSAERSEGFLADFAGRDNLTRGALALDAAGRLLALRVDTVANLGAYTASRGNISPVNIAMASNGYRIPAIVVNVRAVFSHTAPTDPYRGAGRPEILYLVERLLDVAAFDLGDRLGFDRVTLRRRNFIPPDAFPYSTPTGLCYDPCEFAAVLDDALTRADWAGFDARRAASRRRGRLRGIGLASYVERCGGGGGLGETARLQFDDAGRARLLIGTMSNGQGHETAYSQLLAERLGLDFADIDIVQGDTARIADGLGTGGSWSLATGGGAVWLAAGKTLQQARRLAAERFEAALEDIDFDVDRGQFRVAGTDRVVAFKTLAQNAAGALDSDARFEPPNFTFPYGCHVCEVDVDAETGRVSVLNYLAVHDFGRALNPRLLAGQVHGGVAQGIGQALLERVVYDAGGRLLSGSLLDYALPRADDLPAFGFVHRDTPCPHNPLGVKGCGEAGAAGSPPALVNAVADALGVRHIDMPLTPERVWQRLRQTR